MSLIETLVAATLVALAILGLSTMSSGQELQIRHAVHHVKVASRAHGLLGEWEGRLHALAFPRESRHTEGDERMLVGDHEITVSRRVDVEPLAASTGLFRISVDLSWKEPTGTSADRHYATSILVVDPQVGLRDAPAGMIDPVAAKNVADSEVKS